jgi:hypothetical protein
MQWNKKMAQQKTNQQQVAELVIVFSGCQQQCKQQALKCRQQHQYVMKIKKYSIHLLHQLQQLEGRRSQGGMDQQLFALIQLLLCLWSQ